MRRARARNVHAVELVRAVTGAGEVLGRAHEGVVLQSIGECMVKIMRTDVGQASIGCSGDTYNTAVYARRVLDQLAVVGDVSYLSALGEDVESELMRSAWAAEGILDRSIVMPGTVPGLYLISTDDEGERTFTYWRSHSAAAHMFRGTEWVDRVAGDVIYLSGITLQLTSPAARAALVERLRLLRSRGAVVAFDTNYRPSGWSGPDAARLAMAAVLEQCDIALVTLDDQLALGAGTDVVSAVGWVSSLGVPEVIVKVGRQGAHVSDAGGIVRVAGYPADAVDTTAAGDSFNGAYLAARIAGRSPIEAADHGNMVAAAVVRHRGAVLPCARMPSRPGAV